MKYLLLCAVLSPLCISAQIRFSKLYDYNNQHQAALAVLEIPNGGYLIGSKNIWAEYSDNKLLLHRLDALGDEMWQKEIYSEGFIYYLGFNTMLKLPDGNYLLGGDYKEISTQLTDAFLIKMDTLGNVLWEKTYGSSDENDFFTNFALTPDSTHIQICGQTRRTDPSGNIWLLKANLDGEVIWDKEIPAPGWQNGNYIAMLPNGDFLLASHYGMVDNFQYRVYKVSELGQVIWQKKVGTNYDDDSFPKIIALPDGSGLFIGSVGTADWRVRYAYAVRLSSSGDIIWEKTYHTGFSSFAVAQPVVLEDSTIVLSGNIDFDTLNSPLFVRFWKISAEGEMQWEHIYSENTEIDNYIYHQIGTFDGGLIGVGFSFGTSTFQDIWVLKLDGDGCLMENCTVSAVEPEKKMVMNIYPNPATEEIFVLLPDDFEAVTWSITDVFGQVRQVVETHTQGSPVRIGVSQLPTGLYWLQAFDAEVRMSAKLFQIIR